MDYLSTRGHHDPETSFADILLAGLAPDGGLFLPAHYPQVSTETLESWRGLSYADLATEVLGLFVTDLPTDDLRDLCRRTYTAEVFRYGRPAERASEITPIHWLEQDRLGLLQLSGGPTLAFKDMAMQLLGNLFEYVLGRDGSTLNILGATSGDTGSSAEYALRGKDNVQVFMLSPHERMSSFQRAQMFSLTEPNIHNIAVRGMFDDAQAMVKAISNDADFKARHHIGAVNSINWARVAAQVVYYVRAWLAATTGPGEQVDLCVPTGNFGNICAGHVARSLGVPIRRLVLATNENNVLHEFFTTGVYRPRPSAETHVTSSPSMDISRASNFERFVFDLVGRDPAVVRALWAEVEAGGFFDLSGTDHFARVADFGFHSGSSTHADRVAAIRQVYADHRVVIDPHTADGVAVADRFGDDPVPMVVLETALPVKFAETTTEALGFTPERPDDFAGLEDLPQHVDVLDADVDILKRYLADRT